MKREVLRLKNISKFYGKINLISSLSLVVREGEKIALIGPSGSGKSTLLNIMSNSIDINSGEVIISDKNIRDYDNKSLAKEIGMIRQSLDLIPQLAVINNVLVGRLSEWSLSKSIFSLLFTQDKVEVLSILKRVGIEGKYNKRTFNLSGGEQQRVALARLLIQNPNIILADEPVSSLDPARAEDILSLISNIIEQDAKTLIASIHSIEYAKKYFDRVIGVKDGSIEFDMDVADLDQDKIKTLYHLEVT